MLDVSDLVSTNTLGGLTLIRGSKDTDEGRKSRASLDHSEAGM